MPVRMRITNKKSKCKKSKSRSLRNFRKNRISLRKSVMRSVGGYQTGGSPASSHVNSLLPQKCNEPLTLEPLTPTTNDDVSNVQLWKTTGGGKRRKRKSSRKRKSFKKRKSNKRKSRKSRSSRYSR